jgi:hypothetical protein
MISVETYILFVAPFMMGVAGLMIYVIAERLTRSAGQSAPAE